MADRRYEAGLEIYASQFQIPREEVPSWFAERVGERFGEEAILSAAGAWLDDELSLRDRSLVVIAALITQGGAEQQLRVHTRWAIEHGCTRPQLEALATLLGVYAGYPRAGNGLTVVREELAKLDER
jgi:alkylhydroperoxidase/carboxymuconolactone decarboxylase family protein YurZ